MQKPFGWIAGLWALFCLGWHTRFRLSGRYWTWRKETAFGDTSPNGSEKRRALLEYGQWMHTMQKLEKRRRR